MSGMHAFFFRPSILLVSDASSVVCCVSESGCV
jgi:hypothetical protein